MAVKKTCETILGKRYIEDMGWKVTYGISYKSMNIELAVIEDISSNYDFVSRLATKITDGDVSQIHLKDVVEDALE